MSKLTAEDLARELKRRKAEQERPPDQQKCINCGRSFSTLDAVGWEHGLCNDCLMKEEGE